MCAELIDRSAFSKWPAYYLDSTSHHRYNLPQKVVHRCGHTSHEPAALVRNIALVEAQRAPLLHRSRRGTQRTGECRTHVPDTALDGCRCLIRADRGEMSETDGSVCDREDRTPMGVAEDVMQSCGT